MKYFGMHGFIDTYSLARMINRVHLVELFSIELRTIKGQPFEPFLSQVAPLQMQPVQRNILFAMTINIRSIRFKIDELFLEELGFPPLVVVMEHWLEATEPFFRKIYHNC